MTAIFLRQELEVQALLAWLWALRRRPQDLMSLRSWAPRQTLADLGSGPTRWGTFGSSGPWGWRPSLFLQCPRLLLACHSLCYFLEGGKSSVKDHGRVQRDFVWEGHGLRATARGVLCCGAGPGASCRRLSRPAHRSLAPSEPGLAVVCGPGVVGPAGLLLPVTHYRHVSVFSWWNRAVRLTAPPVIYNKRQMIQILRP